MPCFRAPAGARRKPTPGDASALRGQSAGCRQADRLAALMSKWLPCAATLPSLILRKLRRLVAHAVGVRDPVGQPPLLDHVHPIHRKVEGVATHHIRRRRGYRTRGGMLVDVAVRGQFPGLKRDDVRHVVPIMRRRGSRCQPRSWRKCREAPSLAKPPGAAQAVRRFRRNRDHRPSGRRALSSAYRSSRAYQPSAPCLAGGLRRVK